MTTWKKKLVSFLLAFLLTVALLPATAFASDTVGGYCGKEGEGKNLSWSLDLDTGELTISGTGEMKSYGFRGLDSPWHAYIDSIRSVRIGDGITSIGHYAFYGCKNLQGTFYIPQNVSSIGAMVFEECTAINCISVDEGNQYFIVANDILMNKEKTRVLWCPKTKTGQLILPKETRTIDSTAFSGCKQLTGPLVLPKGVNVIGDEAFRFCEGLSGDLVIPEGIETLGGYESYCFADTKFGGKLSLPDSLKSIGTGVFLGTEFSGELLLPKNMETISEKAFLGSRGFDKKLTIPQNTAIIARYAFENCDWIQEVEIEGNLKTVGQGAFQSCKNLEKVIFKWQAPTTIYEDSFPKDVTIYYPEGADGWTTPTWNGYTTVPYKPAGTEEPDVQVDVSLNCNGGTCDKNKISVIVGQAYGALPTPTYPGHVFQGWYTEQEDGDKVAEDTIVTAKEAHTLYAHWTTETYQITYDANGGTGAPEAQKKSYGTNLILSKMVPTRDNYIFQGWAENKTATQAKYQPGAAYTEDRAATLYAVWQQSVPENTAIVSVGNVTLKPGETAEVVASIQNNPGIAGYHFEVAADTSVFSVPKEDGELLVERGDFSKKGSVFANVSENGWETLWYHTNNVTTDGALFRMTVTVSDDAAPGVYPITIQGVPEDIVDENGNMVSLTCVPGTITVADVLLGDVNGDGERTNLDVIYLARSLLGLVTLNDSQKSAADVNDDGIVSNADVIRLARVLIGLDQI